MRTEERSAAPLRSSPLTLSSFSLLAEIPPPSPRTLLHGKLEGAGKHRQQGHLLADLVCFSWKARVKSLAGDRLAVFLEASMASTRELRRETSYCLWSFVKSPERVFRSSFEVTAKNVRSRESANYWRFRSLQTFSRRTFSAAAWRNMLWYYFCDKIPNLKPNPNLHPNSYPNLNHTLNTHF